MKAVRPRWNCTGFSLVEVTLALGVAAFCLVVMLGMIPVGLSSERDATTQTGAVSILRAVAADLRDTPLPTSTGAVMTSPYFSLKVPSATSTKIYVDEGGSVTTQAQARYGISVQTVSAVPSTTRSATQEDVVISWPPQAANATGSLESMVSLDRN